MCGVVLILSSHGVDAQTTESRTTTWQAQSSTQGGLRAADRALQKRVRYALSKMQGLNLRNITVRARNGIVTLEGSVPEEPQIERAGQAAQAVAGVNALRNNLKYVPI